MSETPARRRNCQLLMCNALRSRTIHALVAAAIELAIAIGRVAGVYANPIAHGEVFEEVEVALLVFVIAAVISLLVAIRQQAPALLLVSFAGIILQVGNNVFLAVWAVRLIMDAHRRSDDEEDVFIAILIFALVHITFELFFAIVYFRLRTHLKEERARLEKEEQTVSGLLRHLRELLRRAANARLALRKYFHVDIAKSNVAFIVATIELFKTIVNGLGAYSLLYPLFKDRNALIFEVVLQGIGLVTIVLIFVSLRMRKPAFRLPNIIFQFLEAAGYIYVFIKCIGKLTAVNMTPGHDDALNATQATPFSDAILNYTAPPDSHLRLVKLIVKVVKHGEIQDVNFASSTVGPAVAAHAMDQTSLFTVATVSALVGLAMQVLLIVYSIIDYREMVEQLEEEAEHRTHVMHQAIIGSHLAATLAVASSAVTESHVIDICETQDEDEKLNIRL